MQEDLGQSLVAHSEFVPFIQNKSVKMDESLVAVSEKVYFQNASKINKQEYEKDKKYMKTIGEQTEEQSQNQFLEVGKWKKAKQNSMTKEMAAVKKQVDQIITQTRWHKKSQPEPEKEEVIADESIVPDLDEEGEKNEEIQDQTEQGEEQQEDGEEEQQEQEEQQQQEQEEQESQEEQEQSEQSEQEQQEQEEEQKEQKVHHQEEVKVPNQPTESSLAKTQKKQQKVGTSMAKSKINESNLNTSKQLSSKKIEEKRQSKTQNSQVSVDDRTDAQSEMKRTEYLPAKWTKKRQSQLQNQSQNDSWKRKETILKRILSLVK